MQHGVTPSRVALTAAALVLSLALAPASAPANHVQCGDTITQDTTLDSDIVDCPAPSGWAIRIGASGVSLDLGGHTVDGTGTAFGGISARGSVPGISVSNGRVQQFHFGVHVSSGPDRVVRDVVVTQNFTGVVGAGPRALVERVTAFGNTIGINFGSSVDSVLRDNEVFANEAGMGGGIAQRLLVEGNEIRDNTFNGTGWSFTRDSVFRRNRVVGNGANGIQLVDFSDRNLLVSNDVEGSGVDGIVLSEDSTGNSLKRNRSDRNGDDGIDVDGPGNTLTRNRTFHNGDLGIEAAPGTIDGGKNRAAGNGNPVQCVGVSCK